MGGCGDTACCDIGWNIWACRSTQASPEEGFPDSKRSTTGVMICRCNTASFRATRLVASPDVPADIATSGVAASAHPAAVRWSSFRCTQRHIIVADLASHDFDMQPLYSRGRGLTIPTSGDVVAENVEVDCFGLKSWGDTVLVGELREVEVMTSNTMAACRPMTFPRWLEQQYWRRNR
jgi:hypothetical protein